MSFFKKIFGKKEKEKPTISYTLNLFGKEHNLTMDMSEEAIKKRAEDHEKNKDVYEERKLKRKELKKEQEERKRLHQVQYPFFKCLEILNEMRTPYFTYSKKIDAIREMLLQIEKLPIDSFFEKGKKKAIDRAEENIMLFKFDNTMKKLFEQPTLFLKQLDNFHKNRLMDSVESFYEYWIEAVKLLKQKPTKIKRKLYVIDGLKTLKEELLVLQPTQEEINKVDDMIKKIHNEDWSLL